MTTATTDAIHAGTAFIQKHRNPTRIADTLAEIERIRQTRRDYTVAPRDLRYVQLLDAESNPEVRATINLPNMPALGPLAIGSTAHLQMHTLLGPHFGRYYERLREEHPDLLTTNVNTLLDRRDQSKGLFVRELDGKVRAVLGAGYGVMDNQDLLFTVMPVIEESGGTVMDLSLSEDNFFIRTLVPDWAQRIERQHRDAITGGAIYQQWLANTPEGLLHHYGAEAEATPDEDWIIPGVIFKNSETGRGSLNISMYFLRVICVNGTTAEVTFSRRHVGARREIYTSQETVNRQHALVWSEVKDATSFAFDRERARDMILLMEEATGKAITKPMATMDAVVENHGISEAEKQSIINRLIVGGDPTLFGLVQAVTAEARDTVSVDRKDELERIGGVLLADPKGVE